MRRTNSWVEAAPRSSPAATVAPSAYGHPVGDLRHLVHAMRDEDGAHPLRRAAANDGKQTVPGLDIKRGRRLIEDQYVRVANQRPRDAAGLTEAEGQFLHRAIQLEVAVDEFAEDGPNLLAPFGAGAVGRVVSSSTSKPHVVQRGQGPDGEDLLEHGGDPVLCAARGEREPGQFVAGDRSVPASGRCTPLRILTRVLLPEPFSPTMA